MGIHARRGPASYGSKHEAGDGQNGIDDDKLKTRKTRSTILLRRFLTLWRKYGSTITSPTFASVLLLLLIVVGVNNELPRFKDDMIEGMDAQGLRPSRRLHTISYLDGYTNTRVTRTIQLAAPHRQSSFKSFNYAETESTPWFDYNLPDQGNAFPIPHNRERQCYPMAPWQTSLRQACNHFHEQETAEHNTMLMQFINCGENRCTFLLNSGGETYVLKTLFLDEPSREYPTFFGGPERYLMATKDSLALEKLTSSPYVVNLYASCALAQIVEYSSGGNIHDLLKRSRQRKQLDNVARNTTNENYSKKSVRRKTEFKLPAKMRYHVHEKQQSALSQLPGAHDERFMYISQLSKLKIAYHVATAVADMHALEDHPYGLPSMSHNDLCCHQFMLVDGVYKLGDFDWATILTQTKPATSSSSSALRSRQESPPDLCQTTPLRMTPDYLKALAPEELMYYEDMEDAFAEQGFEGESYEAARVYRDKLDVYQVGSIIYTLLTYLWIWEGHGTYEAIVAVVHGRRAPIPEVDDSDWSDQDRGAYKALRKAIRMAWSQKPEDRPSARELSKFLKACVQDLASDADDLLRVSIPPLPPDHRYSDSDYNANWEFGEE